MIDMIKSNNFGENTWCAEKHTNNYPCPKYVKCDQLGVTFTFDRGLIVVAL